MFGRLSKTLVAAIGAIVLVLAPTAAVAAPTQAAGVATVSNALIVSSVADMTGGCSGDPGTKVTCEFNQQTAVCQTIGEMILCSADNDDDRMGQACYGDIFNFAGAVDEWGQYPQYVVCTTSAAQQQHYLTVVGESALTHDFGCDLVDFLCKAQQSATTTLATASLQFSFFAQEAMSFNTDTLLWTTAMNQWSFWAWAVLIVVLVAGVVGITRAMFLGERDGIISAFVRLVIVVPATQLTLYLSGMVIDSIDSVGRYILENTMSASLFGTFQKMAFVNGKSDLTTSLLVTALSMLAMIMLLVVFLIRNFALAALIMVGPLAWMMSPDSTLGKEMVTRYFAALTALILCGPLMMSLLAFILDGLASAPSIYDSQAWPFLIAMVLMGFAPFAIFALFSFAGGVAVDEAAGRGGMRAAGAARATTRGARNMVTSMKHKVGASRVGQRPAGVAPSGSGAATPVTGRRSKPASPNGQNSSPTSTSRGSVSTPKPVPSRPAPPLPPRTSAPPPVSPPPGAGGGARP